MVPVAVSTCIFPNAPAPDPWVFKNRVAALVAGYTIFFSLRYYMNIAPHIIVLKMPEDIKIPLLLNRW